MLYPTNLKKMKKKILIILSLIIGIISCKNEKQRVNKLEIAKNYYKFLDLSNSSAMTTLLSDSILIREKQDDYEEQFSRKGYIEWLKWDSVFNPTYNILEIKQDHKAIRAKISKIDKRILFLHEEPMVWYEVIQFDHDKIIKIERIEYETFNIEKFLKNRDKLLKWSNKNHPELKGFLYDQTESGGIKYLKAIQLYNDHK